MELRQYLEILLRRKWVIILTTLVTVLVAALGSRLQHPSYSAAAMVRIAQAPSGAVEYGDYIYAERLINTYGEIVKSRPFLDEVIAGLDLTITPEQMAKQVKVAVVLNTELLRITVEDSDPARAAAIANTLANLLVLNSQTLYRGGGRSARQILEEQLSVAEANLEQDRAALQALVNSSVKDEEGIAALRDKVQLQADIYANLLRQYETARVEEASRANSVSVSEAATQPLEPSRPRLKLNIVLGLLLGLLGGVALAFLFENLDPTLHTASEAEAMISPSGVPFLGSIPEEAGIDSTKADPAIVDHAGHSPASEAYRILRTNAFSTGVGASLKTLLVTGPEPGTGKSTVSANLAVTLAEGGRTVVLVDADLRRPRLHSAFNLPNKTGLSNLLRNHGGSALPLQTLKVQVDTVLQKTSYVGLRLLTSGPLPPNPTESLDSERMQTLIAALSGKADIILVDSPPVLAVADATILAPLLDGVLLVTARDQSTGKRVQRTVQLLEKAGARPLGLVFNRAQRKAEDYYYHYSRSATEAGRRRAERVQLALAAAGVALAICIVSLGALTLLVGPDRMKASSAQLIAATLPSSQSQGALSPPISSPLPRDLSTPETSEPGTLLKNGPVATPVPLRTGPTPTAIRLLSGVPRATAQNMNANQNSPQATSLPDRGAAEGISIPEGPALLNAPAATVAPPASAESDIVSGTVGYIASGQSGLSGGTFLLEDPYWRKPGAIWLPDGWRVEVLEANVPGRTSYGSSRWHRVRCTIGGQIYVGFVPARAVVGER
jgi:succinoglycan biosynthesis transport protein ExoP